MRAYFLPTSEDGLKDRVFPPPPSVYRGGISNMRFWSGLRDALRKLGAEVHTTDFWKKKDSRPDDILLVQNHPGETFVWRAFYFLKHLKNRGGFVLDRRRFLLDNYRFFAKRILLQMEPEQVMPYVYKNLRALRDSGIYTKIFLHSRGYGKEYGYFNYYDMRSRNIMSPYFGNPKEKFLVMINTNTRPHSLSGELYGERIKAIKFFSNVPGFDLYGHRWDELPRHPLYIHYKKYISRAWRGAVENKLETLSHYKFCICFENCLVPGWVTEKIFDCLAAGTIPVYFGAPDIATIVPEGCFIDFRRFRNYDELKRSLVSMSEEEMEKCRRAMTIFLDNKKGEDGLPRFAREILN